MAILVAIRVVKLLTITGSFTAGSGPVPARPRAASNPNPQSVPLDWQIAYSPLAVLSSNNLSFTYTLQ